MKPNVKLVSWTPNPLETNWILWEASKSEDLLAALDAAELAIMVRNGLSTAPNGARVPTVEEMTTLFWQVLRQHIPVAEHLSFVFMLENVSVSFREQMVRHRIGTHVGDRVGVDIVPDLHDSTFWSQSMRIQSMAEFSRRHMYRIPETLAGKVVEKFNHEGNLVSIPAGAFYADAMDKIQDAYNALVAAGVPMEDARELIPLGAQHRISWGVNLQSLLHILGKRGCWILQLGIWGPIIRGMVEELATKVHPIFRRLVAPPCIGQDGKFSSCLYRLENIRRMPQPDGQDPPDRHSPCPLYVCSDAEGAAEFKKVSPTVADSPAARKEALLSSDSLLFKHKEMKARAEEYRTLWDADPYTWSK